MGMLCEMACNVILTVVVFLVWGVCLASGSATLLRSHSSEDVTINAAGPKATVRPLSTKCMRCYHIWLCAKQWT